MGLTDIVYQLRTRTPATASDDFEAVPSWGDHEVLEAPPEPDQGESEAAKVAP